MPFFPISRLIFASLFKKEATLAYPVSPIKRHESVRGHVGIDIESCIFCGICQRKCPTDAIIVNKNDKEWQISRFSCVQCGACIEGCPKKCLHMNSSLSESKYIRNFEKVKYARISADDEHN